MTAPSKLELLTNNSAGVLFKNARRLMVGGDSVKDLEKTNSHSSVERRP